MSTVNELKEQLRAAGLPSYGTKAEMILRLTKAGISIASTVSEQDPAVEQEDESTLQEDNTTVRENDNSDEDRDNESVAPVTELSLLRRANDLAEREIRLLKREMELLRTSPHRDNVSASSSQRRIKWNHVGNLFGDFDGSDREYESWEAQAKHLVDYYELDENEAKAMICQKLKGKALRWYTSRTDSVHLSFHAVLREMRRMFSGRPNVLKLRREFEERKWHPDETFADYVHDKVTLGNRVPINDNEIVDYVIEGIPDGNLQRLARTREFTTVAALQNAFSTETIKAVPSESRSNLRFDRKRMFQKEAHKHQRQREAEKPRCYNCHERGHYASNCKQQKRERGTCYRCGQPGHRVEQCNVTKEGVNQITKQPDDDFHRMLPYEFRKNESHIYTDAYTLIDTGSPVSFIKERYVPREFRNSVCARDSSFYGINSSKLVVLGMTDANIKFNDEIISLQMRVVPNDTMNTSAILGRDFLREAKIALGKPSDFSEILSIEFKHDDVIPISQQMIINERIPNNVKLEAQRLFEEKYVAPPRPENPKVSNIMKLTLTDDKPFYCSPRRLSYSEKSSLKVILNDLLEKGAIRQSESQYASPIVLVKKRNGEMRMCIDFRTLNKVTTRDNFPLPLIEDQLDLLHEKKYFTTLDLKDGFFHIKMHEESIKYTSFVTPLGQYECILMPFGLKGAPLKFQRYVSEIFRELVESGDVSIYLDDFLVATRTIEHHLKVLEKVFHLLVENRLELRLDKCKFLQTELEYLGYTVTCEGIRPTSRGIEAVQQFPVPRNVREVQSFLGLTSYFRKFVENFSIIAKPLYDLVKKNTEFKFDREETQAFEALKKRLAEAPILAIYCPRDETELHCDASASGYGAIMLQRKADHKFHPIFYFSKRTTEVESRYHSFELETLAIIYALRRFRTYLQGIKFKILTDCQSLTLTLNKKDVNPRIARWALELQNYDYTLEHRAGTRMAHVDALSRNTYILTLTDNSFERNLALSQSGDSDIVQLRKKLEKSEDHLFEMRNGLVYRKRDERLLFYVPAKMVDSVLHKYHNELGHVGLDKTREIILRSYWFPQMKAKIDAHIKNCLTCVAYSPMSGKIEGHLHNIPKGNLPFTDIHIDHLGPMTKAHSIKKRYVFLIIDAFTKFIKLYATKTTSTKEVISCLREYFSSYSRPLRIISDRGSCFTSHEFANFVKGENIIHIKVATASPQANGQVERVNRFITPMIAKLADERKTHWYDVLMDVEFACNNTVNRSTGQSPSMLLFGINQRGNVIDGVREALQADGQGETNRDLKQIRANAQEQNERVQDSNKKNFDRKRKPATKYQVDDLVMIRNFVNSPGVSTKMIPKFKGPYRIIRVLRNDRYVVSDIDGFQISQTPYQGTWEPANMRPWSRDLVNKT